MSCSAKEAYKMVQANIKNTKFKIIDVRMPD